jgi:molybdopterin biosynthesis enzyme
MVAYFSSFSRSTSCNTNGFPSPVAGLPGSPNSSLSFFFLVILAKLMQKQYLKISSQQVIPFEAG